MNELSFEEQVKAKNRRKLLLQNTKLLSEIRHLQTEIDGFQQLPLSKIQQQQAVSGIKSELQGQMKEIKRLKELIQTARHGNVKQNIIYIRKEEDELLCLKQEMEAMQTEKELITNGHNDKLKKLAQNQPLQKHKEELQNLWASTKKENRQLNLRMVQLERQVRKYHNFKQRSKGGKVEALANPTEQLNSMEAYIERMNGELKAKELKWKTNVDCLDRQFFGNKNTLTLMSKKIEELQKEQGIWRLRAANLRDQPEITTDRARLSKIITIAKSETPNALTTHQRVSLPLPFPVQSSKHIINSLKLGSSLNRVSSSPNPSGMDKIEAVKKSRVQQILSKRYNEQLSLGKQKKLSEGKSQGASKSVKMGEQSSLQQLKTAKKKKGYVEKSNKSVFLQPQVVKGSEQKKEEPSKESGWVGRRQKHRIKSSAASDLAEQIKRRAEEVKLINQNFEVQRRKQQNQSASKLKKNLVPKQELKQKKLQSGEQVKSQIYKKLNQQNKQIQSPRITKQKSRSSLEKAELSVGKDLKSNSKQIIKEKEEIKPKQKKGKQLVQTIDLKSQPPKMPLRSQSPKLELKKQQNIKINVNNDKKSPQAKPKESPIVKQPKQSNEPIINREIPKKKKQPSQIKFQIKISDKIPSRHITDPIEDESDGVPKIVYRRKVAQGSQVTTGTST